MKRLLSITSENKLKAAALALEAERPSRWFRPPAGPKPEDQPELCCVFDGWLSLTFAWVVDHTDGNLYRMAWLKLVRDEGLPDPDVCINVAGWLGFTGGKEVGGLTVEHGSDWKVAMMKKERAIVIGQRVTRLVLA
jgi:hypothetical protein